VDGGWDIKWKSGNGGLMERKRGKEGGRQEKNCGKERRSLPYSFLKVGVYDIA